MTEIPRRQICACGKGCDDRSSVKWCGWLVVTCVPDDEAIRLVEAIIEAARKNAAAELAAVVAFLRRETYPCCNQCNNEIANYIERGDHHKEQP